jgi:uncharacterized Zn-binding protein involved in type VI secretion
VDPFATFGSAPPSPGGAVFTTRPTSLRICVYHAGSDAADTQFSAGATVTGATEDTLLAGLASARQSGPCTPPRALFAIISAASGSAVGTSVFVELGGCDRVLRYGPPGNVLTSLRMGQATPAAVALVEAVTHL